MLAILAQESDNGKRQINRFVLSWDKIGPRFFTEIHLTS